MKQRNESENLERKKMNGDKQARLMAGNTYRKHPSPKSLHTLNQERWRNEVKVNTQRQGCVLVRSSRADSGGNRQTFDYRNIRDFLVGNKLEGQSCVVPSTPGLI